MSADQYLQGILERERVDTTLSSPVRILQTRLGPIIQEWAGDKLVSVTPSGSFAKGTAIKSGTNIDLFISLSAQTPETLKEIYNNLYNRMNERGYAPKIQNVSVKVRVDGYDVDLVPAKRQDSYTDDAILSIAVGRKRGLKQMSPDTSPTYRNSGERMRFELLKSGAIRRR